MANVDIISVSVVDYKGDTGNVVYYVPTGQALGDIELQAQTFAALLDDVTGGVIQGMTITKQMTLPSGLKDTALAAHNIEKGGNIGFDCANTPYRTTIRVPAIAEAIVTGEVVDITTANDPGDLFCDHVVAGLSPVLPSDKYGNDITARLEGVVTFRKA
jgi:hypothetical protein